jgi:hypothetical protein
MLEGTQVLNLQLQYVTKSENYIINFTLKQHWNIQLWSIVFYNKMNKSNILKESGNGQNNTNQYKEF